MKESRQEKITRIKAALISVGYRKELSAISMYDIAHEAKMSPSTVYHYFSNMNELILDYLEDIFNDFHSIVRTCTNELTINHWKDINQAIQSSLSLYCDENAVVKKILYTHHQYHDIKSVIVEKDNELGVEMEKIYRKFFVLPQLPETHNIFVIALEASDSVYFSRNAGLKDDAVNNEAIIVAQSYLSHYLPDYLPKVGSEEKGVSY